jgi:hypothetical protein
MLGILGMVVVLGCIICLVMVSDQIVPVTRDRCTAILRDAFVVACTRFIWGFGSNSDSNTWASGHSYAYLGRV